jgi:uncharacterized membrane protein YgaE (UPF0421/DUF939 family)
MLNFLTKLQSDTSPPSPFAIYSLMAKCMSGVGICFYLASIWPNYPFEWAMISVVLSLSLDNRTKFAIERIVSNTLGCMIGLLLFPIPLPHLLLLCIGMAFIIWLTILLKITDMIRQSLAAFVIVMLREENSQLWFIPLHRVVTVMAGCIIAVLLTLFFGISLRKISPNKRVIK